MPDKKECYSGTGKPVTFDLDAAAKARTNSAGGLTVQSGRKTVTL
jgi:hypothetical protein